MNNNVKCRYEEFLKLYLELYNIVPESLIAAYVGVSRESLNRFLKCDMGHINYALIRM
jgi:hypothetical protein